MKRPIIFLRLLAVCFASGLTALAGVTVRTERLADDRRWQFQNIPRPSQSDAGLNSRISVAGCDREMSCLSPDGLHNGVLPWTGKNRRDFFAFSNFNPNDGSILMDLGRVQPIAAVAAYSWQQPHGGFLNGMRAPQVYALYASAADHPNPADPSAWTRLAEVDTRANGWGGQHGSVVSDDHGGALGQFRWLRWDVKRTLKAGERPEWTNTWFTELDVHTPKTLPRAGDAVMAGSQLEETVLAFKTHFDIGFTHRAPEIVNIYRTDFIDRALGVIDASQKLPPEERFAWTIPSWVLAKILWPGQDPARRERVIRAVKQGSLVVHALPVTLQTESMDLEDLVAGLAIHTNLARELDIPLSRAGKMTDVPSHSWVLPTLLNHAGIDFLHIGCNPTNERPDVPLLYNWEGPDGSRLLTFHNQGYGSDIFQGISPGSIYPPKDWPYKHWLALNNGSDNTPPPTAGQVKALFDELKRNLPQVKVKLGKMEDFADAIAAEERAGAKVPVIRADMPDCWIHGMGTLPLHDAMAHKARPELVAAGSLDTHLRAWGLPRPNISAKLRDAYEGSVMYGEHTWGGAKNLQGRNAYAMTNFAEFIKTDATCQYLQRTWDDKAAYIEKTAAISAKLVSGEMAQLASAVNVEGERMVVFNPLPHRRDAIVETPKGGKILVKDLPPSGYKTIQLDSAAPTASPQKSDSAVLENPFLKVTLDRARGGVVSIVDIQTGRELVDPKAKYAFGQYLYQRFDRQQAFDYDVRCEHIDSVYGLCTGWNIRADLPGNVPYAEAVPSYTEMSVADDGAARTATLTAPAAGIIASKVTTTITLPADAPWLEIAVRLDEKQPDYWPENCAIYFPVKADQPQFRLGRLGGIADPTKDFARNSNRTYGYVNTGAIIAGADGQGLAFCPLDHGILSVGEKGIHMIDPNYAPTTPVAMVSLFNNLWTINFPYWFGGSVQSRVRVWPTRDLKPASLNAPALEARQPVLTTTASGPAGKLPAEMAGLAVSRPAVRLTWFGNNRDGEGTILRLWEQAGEAAPVTVSLPVGAKFTTAQPVNLRGEQLGEPIAVRDGRFTFLLAAYAPASFRLTPELPISNAAPVAGPRTTTRLSELDLSEIQQGWGAPQQDRSVAGTPLRIGGVDYPAGIGTHATMTWEIDLDGQGVVFTARVGLQDLGVKGKGSVEFLVLGDDKPLFKSGVLRSGDPAVPVNVDLTGVRTLTLQVTDAGDGNSADHADWIAPEITHPTATPL